MVGGGVARGHSGPVVLCFLIISVHLADSQTAGGGEVQPNTPASSSTSAVNPTTPTLLSTTSSSGSPKVKVLTLQQSGVPSNTSYARLRSPFPQLLSFTVCYRLRLNRFREESTLMSYAVSSNKDNELRMDHRMTGFKVSLHSKWAKTSLQTPLQVWSHFCFLYQFPGGAWTIYFNGQLRANGSLPFQIPLDGNGAYIIGQEQDAFGSNFQRDQSFSGEITQLNFWPRELSPETISKVWELHGEVQSVQRPLEELCDHNHRVTYFFPDRFNLAAAQQLCQVVGGRVAVPQDQLENAELFEVARGRAQYCSGRVGESFMWLGAHDNQEERLWRYLDSGQPIPWESRWRGLGPNGGAVENCLVMLYGSYAGLWSDIACLDSYAFCVPCEAENMPVLYLKGPAVCSNSPFNQKYLLGKRKNGYPYLMGFFHTDLYWNSTRAAWVLQSLKVRSASAWWAPSHRQRYPFGTNAWTLDLAICGLQAGQRVNLTLSTCASGEFTCEDGSCIPLSQRCDLRVDCADQSDESDCSLVDLPGDYQASIPPSPTTTTNTLHVHFTISIFSFPVIATEDQTFSISFQLKLQWKDQRLKYLNLKNDSTLNVVSQEAKHSIWTPVVFFSNAHGNVFTNLDQGSRIKCIPEAPSQVGGPHLTKETNIFSGVDNSLEMSQLYSVTYSCDFDLLMFPFDAQVCVMNFVLVSASHTYMNLVPSVANYTGMTNLIEYSIGHVSMQVSRDNEFSRVEVEVQFMRRYGFYLLTLYIPTTLLIFIAYATFFFNPDDFNSRIVVALTSLLVLASLFTQTSNSLPKTSYFKLVDVWLFFSIVMIFLVVMLQTLIDFSRQPLMDQHSMVVQAVKKAYRILNKLGASSTPEEGKLTCTPVEVLSGPTVRVHTLTDNRDGRKLKVENWTKEEERQERGQGAGRVPVYGRAHKSNNWAENQYVNMSLMSHSRIFIPVLFLIFNCCYWGVALKYVSDIYKKRQ